MKPRAGSLFSGYGGLDLAVQEVFGTEVVWHCEWEAAPSAILEHHWPGVPNLHDVTEVDWTTVPPVDILTGGYPCQPFSAAGKRKGTNDERHLWPYVREAIRVLRPRYTVLENVAATGLWGSIEFSETWPKRDACPMDKPSSFRHWCTPSPRAPLHPRHSCRRRRPGTQPGRTRDGAAASRTRSYCPAWCSTSCPPR